MKLLIEKANGRKNGGFILLSSIDRMLKVFLNFFMIPQEGLYDLFCFLYYI